MKAWTVDGEWRGFAAKVFSGREPQIQKTEMRRGFYAGFYSMLAICHEIGGDDITEDQGVFILENLDQEVKEFFENLKARKPGY